MTLPVMFLSVATLMLATGVRIFAGTWDWNPATYLLQIREADPMSMKFDVALWIHVMAGFMWVLAVCSQMATAMLFSKWEKLRPVHRFVGTFVGPTSLALMLPMGVLASVFSDRFPKYPVSSKIAFLTTIVVNGLQIIVNIAMGIRSARQQDYPTHKEFMFWGLLSSLQPGADRFGMSIVQLMFPSCAVERFGTFFGSFISVVCLTLLAIATSMKAGKLHTSISKWNVAVFIFFCLMFGAGTVLTIVKKEPGQGMNCLVDIDG